MPTEVETMLPLVVVVTSEFNATRPPASITASPASADQPCVDVRSTLPVAKNVSAAETMALAPTVISPVATSDRSPLVVNAPLEASALNVMARPEPVVVKSSFKVMPALVLVIDRDPDAVQAPVSSTVVAAVSVAAPEPVEADVT